jgi:outer membrane protein assembly factor BamB
VHAQVSYGCIHNIPYYHLAANGSSTLFIATYDGAVTALHASDGKVAGPRFYEGEMIRSTPAVFEFSPALAAYFFVAGDGKLYSVDCGTGKLLWANAYGNPGDYQASSPAVYDFGNGTVLVFVGSIDGTLHAVDANSGAFVWVLQTGGPIYSSPKVRSLPDGSIAIVVGSDDGNVYAANALSGAALWQFKTADMMRGSFNFTSVTGNSNVTVFFGSNDFTVYALDLATGDLRWSFATAGYVTSTPQVRFIV